MAGSMHSSSTAARSSLSLRSGRSPEQRAPLAMMGFEDHRLAPAAVLARGDLARAPPLRQELFDHPQRHSETGCDLLPRALPTVIRSQDPFPQIERKCFHLPTITPPAGNGFTFI